jgi:dienelactone hydrolase
MKKINWRIPAAMGALALSVLTFAFVLWAGDIEAANEIALSAMNSDSRVYVSGENGWVVFHPADALRPETGFIFYPGGKVDYRAYAPVLKSIAAQGYFVVLVPEPLNLALFNVNAGAAVQSKYPEVANWFVGGHSLGGVAASMYVRGRENIRGLVLWAATPADDSLRGQDIAVLSVYGTLDGLFPEARVDESRRLLPDDAIFFGIEGGNHSQFGSYGLQEGDLEAAIPPEGQWDQTASVTVEFFEGVLK